MSVTIVSTSTPHGLEPGHVLVTNRGDTLIVRKATAYSFVASSPRWYERLRWRLSAKWANARAWWAYVRLERKLRRP